MSEATILIVEDEAIIAADLAGKLSRLGYAISGTTGFGEEAVNHAREQRPDLVLMDIRLAGNMDGIEAAEIIRRELDLPVIFLTAHSDRATLDRAKLAEPFGYILKPFEERELTTNIEMALYKHQTDHRLRQAHDDLELRVEERTRELREAERVLREMNETLEQRVTERTAELESANALLRNSRLAALNMMEDAVTARRQAEETSADLQREATERKLAEAALRESELFYRQTLESIPGMVFTTRPDGYCDYQSQQWVDFTGVPMVEHLGDGWNKLLHPDDRPRAFDAWREAVEERAPYDLEYRVRRQDGVYEWFKVRGRPIHDAAGQIVRWFGTALNVDRLVKIEEELRHNESILAQAGQMANLGAWEIEISNLEDFDANPLRWSDEAYRIFGYRPGEVEVTNALFFERTHPDDREKIREAVARAVELKQPYSVEHRIIRPDGSERTVFEHAEISFDDLDRPVHFLGAIQDISERTRYEEALRRSTEEWERTFNSVPDLIALMDGEHRIVRANRAMAERLNITAEQCVGQECYLGVHGSDQPPQFCPHSLTLADGLEHSAEVHEERLGGYFLVTTTPLLDECGIMIGTVHVARDITAVKQAEEKLRNARDELELRVTERTEELAMAVETLLGEIAERERAELALREKEKMLLQQSRLAAMGEMINNIAHQWRQPLNSLGLTIQSSLLFYDLGDFNREFLQKNTEDAMKMINHMSRTIDDFRNFFRSDKEKTEFSVKQAIQLTLSLIESTLRNNDIDIVLHIDGDPRINGFFNEFSQSLLNILQNASDVLIERNIAGRQVTIAAGVENGRTVVTISDNAGGIPDEQLVRIFEPYFSTKGVQGTGIGLFMSKTIIETNMGGSISARNTAHGAEFKIEV